MTSATSPSNTNVPSQGSSTLQWMTAPVQGIPSIVVCTLCINLIKFLIPSRHYYQRWLTTSYPNRIAERRRHKLHQPRALSRANRRRCDSPTQRTYRYLPPGRCQQRLTTSAYPNHNDKQRRRELHQPRALSRANRQRYDSPIHCIYRCLPPSC